MAQHGPCYVEAFTTEPSVASSSKTHLSHLFWIFNSFLNLGQLVQCACVQSDQISSTDGLCWNPCDTNADAMVVKDNDSVSTRWGIHNGADRRKFFQAVRMYFFTFKNVILQISVKEYPIALNFNLPDMLDWNSDTKTMTKYELRHPQWNISSLPSRSNWMVLDDQCVYLKLSIDIKRGLCVRLVIGSRTHRKSFMT